VEYFNYLGSIITNDARCRLETKCRIAITKALFNRKNIFIDESDLKVKEKTSELLHLDHSFVWG
jgi:hypothetical protein